jgi:predicted DNA-binding ribbon-helix-helix protein
MPPSFGIEPLKSQNITIGGHRTSMRLEPSMWEALYDIAQREELSINELCSMIKERLEEQKRLKGISDNDKEVTLTSAVRVFIAAYYRRASTEDGHNRAGHGGGDPFRGTPFERARETADLPAHGDRATLSSQEPDYTGSGAPDCR